MCPCKFGKDIAPGAIFMLAVTAYIRYKGYNEELYAAQRPYASAGLISLVFGYNSGKEIVQAMEILNGINIITLVMVCIFAAPILSGIIWPLTHDRVRRSFSSLLNSLILLASILLAAWLTRVLLSSEAVLAWLYRLVPDLQGMMEFHAFWMYLGVFLILSLLIGALLHLLALPFYIFALTPVSHIIASAISSLRGFARRVVSALWKLPKAIWLVLLFTILLNFYTSYFNSPVISAYAGQSAPYQLIQQSVVQPLLRNSTVKNIQVLFNDSFKTAETEVRELAGKYLVRYFNGMTLEEATASSAEIDAAAREIVGTETDDRQKAYLVYMWICENLTYDNEKAVMITQDPSRVSSGAIVAFSTRTGICFDFACLYVAMCRAVDVKVRFLTGLGYNGVEWGDHAWNQAYVSGEDVWINVDTTFGSSGVSYFDTPHFYLDHQDGIVQGEW